MISGPKPGSETTRIHMKYDAWNRQTAVYADNNGSPGSTIAEYRYDGLNQRIAKLLPNGQNWDRTDFYYNAAWQCLEERYGANQAKETLPTNAKIQWLWSVQYIDAPVLRWRDTDDNGTLDETLYYTNDANMNVTALINTDGSIAERYVYDPYGKPTIYDDDWSDTVSWANSKQNEILYCGYRFNQETGKYDVRRRPYDFGLGRWPTHDPIEADRNPYEYVGSRPLVGLDPQGLKWELIAHDYTGELGQKAMAAIAALAPDGYQYVTTFHMDQLRSNLEWAAKQPKYKYSSVIARVLGASGFFTTTWNQIVIVDDSPPNLVHEVTHAYDYYKGIYTGWFFSDYEKAEALGYTMQNLYGNILRFKSFEDALNDPQFTPAWAAENRPCSALRAQWLGLWNGLKSVYSGQMKWRGNIRNLTPDDVEDVEARLEFNISCKEIVGLYNAIIKKRNILDEEKPGSCCILECPPDLGPFE